jgi:multiple sugar transport system ATP-binding protein
VPVRKGLERMAEIRFEDVRKNFGKFPAVDGVDLDVKDKEFVVLLGPSGCGKTTLLRCLAGLERVDGGRVFIGDRDATDLAPRRRRIAMVFQSYAVFPHMKVFDNIAFGLRMQKERKSVIRERVQSSAELLHIEELLDRYSSQLSGGQRQRVAVARAIATKADVLLMDEPLSNLDALLRLEMRAELKALLQGLDATTIYVTHDQIEALSMGDRIAVMNKGRIVQLGNPLEVYDNPADTFVGGFIGTPPMNFLEAKVTSNGNGSGAVVEVSGGSFEFPSDVSALTGHNLLLGIRAEAIGVETAGADGLVRAKVIVLEPLGSHNLLTVRCGEDMLKVSVHANLFPLPDSDVWLRLEPARIRWMDRDSGTAIESGAEELATETAIVIS